MSIIPKAVLYYSVDSCWSSAVLLALEEKGYGEDEIDLRVVDLGKGENFSPAFLRLNHQGTVPILVVPLQKTLSEDVESRYKPIIVTKTIIEFLDKSRSPLSHTHTTSSSPAPSLAPATIAFTETSRSIIDLLHSDEADLNKLEYLNAVDDSTLRTLAKSTLPFLRGRSDALGRYLTDAQSGAIHVTEKVQSFWRDKKTSKETLLDVFINSETSEQELDQDNIQKRREYFAAAHDAWQIGIKNVLETLNKELSGPLLFGEQISIADLHIAGWLARIAMLIGVSGEDDGKTLESKLKERVHDLTLVKNYSPTSTEGQFQSKIGGFWDTMKERPSWKKVYGSGLH